MNEKENSREIQNAINYYYNLAESNKKINEELRNLSNKELHELVIKLSKNNKK